MWKDYIKQSIKFPKNKILNSQKKKFPETVIKVT